ncbi:MAG: type II secretion system F family protein [Cryobacterium sp.]|nr:type II secretion system F family protein [Oligoflexia bacterium]
MSLLSGSDRDLVLYAGYLAVFLAVYLVSRMLLSEEERSAAQENLADLRNRKSSSKLVQTTRPFFTQYVVPMVRGKKLWENRRIDYRRKLITAGLREELTPDEFIAYKCFLIFFFPVVGLVLNAMGFLDLSLITILGTGIAGFFYPDFWVNGLITKRQKQILRSMPFVVDLLSLSTEAGLDFIGAIQKVVDKAAQSPLIEELGQMLREIKVGSSRAEALREMSNRIGMTEVNSFVAILISADQMGASIGKILRQQSEQIRSERLLRAEKEGAKAASKVLLPSVMFLLPAVILMVAGPFILGFMKGGGL